MAMAPRGPGVVAPDAAHIGRKRPRPDGGDAATEGERGLVSRLVDGDLAAAAASLPPERLAALAERLRACAGALEERFRELAGAPLGEAPCGFAALDFGAVSGDVLAERCLVCLGARDLARVRSLSRQWRLRAEADALWRPFAVARWSGADALAEALHAWASEPRGAAGSSGATARGRWFASIYLRRCWLDRNKVVHGRMLPLYRTPQEASAGYAALVELSVGGRVLSGMRDLVVALGGAGLEAPAGLPPDFGPIDPASELVQLSLTVLRRRDGKLMRVCSRAELDWWTEEDDRLFLPREPHVAFRMGGDASDGLMHPALWSVTCEPMCHYVALTGVTYVPQDDEGRIAAFDEIFVGLEDPRDFLDSNAASRLLTVWEEVAEWG